MQELFLRAGMNWRAQPINIEQLEELIDDAESAAEDIVISIDGGDVDEDSLWVTQEEWDALQEAFKKAEEAAANRVRDLDEIYNELRKALEEFEAAKKAGNKEIAIVYTITLDVHGQEDGDSVTLSSDTGHEGDVITISYTVADNGLHNQLSFGGVAGIAGVTEHESGERTYTVNPADASGGMITIIATFTHTNLELDPIAFTNEGNITVTYGNGSLSNAVTSDHSGSGTITYTSSDTSVATVNTNGTVTILRAGSAVITANKAADDVYAHASQSYVLTVAPRPLTISGAAHTKVYDGNTTATGVTVNLSGVLPADTYNVEAGTVTAAYTDANAGTTSINITSVTLSGTAACNYTVAPVTVTVTGITKADPNVTWPAGLTAVTGQTLSSITLPGNGTSTPPGTFTWDNPDYSVGAVGTQSHSMTFTPTDTDNYNTVMQDVTITVTAPAVIPVTEVSINKASTIVLIGGTETLTAEVAPANATNPSVTWSSNTPAIAAVSADGVVTGVAMGVTVITATSVDGSGVAGTCLVIVNNSVELAELFISLAANDPNNANTPYSISVNMNLGGGGWDNLMNTLNLADRYVNLDLSESTGMSTFDPGTGDTGERLVVSLTLPESSTAIADGPHVDGSFYDSTFIYFTNLKHFDTGNGVTTIGEYAFQMCASLESVNIGDSVTSIRGFAFLGTSLTSVNIGNSVTSIGDHAFASCISLTNITIPNSVTIIESAAFYNCRIISVIIPDSVITIGGSAFSGNNLTSVEIPDSITSIGQDTFARNQLTSITIPDSVTTIGNSAFMNNQLTGITIPDGVTTIDTAAFMNNQLTGVTIPDSVTTIGVNAFMNNQITRVTIGEDVTLNTNSFGYNFESVYNTGGQLAGTYTRPSTTSTDWTWNISSISGLASYLATQPINTPSNPINLSMLLAEGFSEWGGIREAINDAERYVNIDLSGSSITDIGEWAFNSCTYLTGITIPNSVISIEGYAFGSSGLISIIIPDSVISIGNMSFAGCQSLTSVTIGNSVTTIGTGAFEGCSILTSVNIGSSVTTIGYSAFYVCTSLTSIVIPDGVTTIDNSAFWGCTGLTNITIPASVTFIEHAAFHDTSITSVTFMGSDTFINDAFLGNLHIVYSGEGIYTRPNVTSEVWTKQ